MSVIDRILIIADNFKTRLMELPQPAGLRLFVAKHRAFVINFQRLAQVAQAIFNVRSGDGRGSFRAQSQRIVSFGFQHKHLLFNYFR